MRFSPAILVFIAAAGPLFAAPEPAAKPAGDTALSPADAARSRELQDLVAEEKALYARFAKDDAKPETALPQAEKERRVKEIVKRYETLLGEDPEHLETILLYAKFLRRIDERDYAFRLFVRADRLAPNLAAVKHQLAAHLAEDGRAAEARPLFLRAVALAPDEPVYRYDYGEFLATATSLYEVGGPLSRDRRDHEMLEAFAAAARLKPVEPGYRWRAAAAWYDVKKPDTAAALAAWTAIANDATSPEEKEATGLHRARWLVASGRVEEARALIRASTTPALDATRRRLLDEIAKREPGFRDIGTDPARSPVAK